MSNDPRESGPARAVAACLDQATLQQLLSLDDGATGLLAELFGLFKDDAPERMDGMEKAILSGDSRAAAELAHALKGAAGTIGAARMRGLAQEIEKAGKAGSLDAESLARVEELREAYREACAALDAFLAGG